MTIGAMITSFTFFLYKVQTYFKVMTKIAPLAIRTKIVILEFLASFYFRFIVGVDTAISLLAFSMDKFLTYPISRQLWIITRWCRRLWGLINIAGLGIHSVIGIGHHALLISPRQVPIWVCHLFNL